MIFIKKMLYILTEILFFRKLIVRNQREDQSEDQRTAYANLHYGQTFGTTNDAEIARHYLNYVCSTRK